MKNSEVDAGLQPCPAERQQQRPPDPEAARVNNFAVQRDAAWGEFLTISIPYLLSLLIMNSVYPSSLHHEQRILFIS